MSTSFAVEVWLRDTRGRMFQAHTNCAGNFYVRPSQFLPAFPLWVTLRFGRETIDMESPMHADGSCGTCHGDPRAPTSAGHVYLTDDPTNLPKLAAATACGAAP